MKIKINRFDDRAMIPHRAHYDDAGADVYLMEPVRIDSLQTVFIKLGFGVEIPNGYMGQLIVRSSLAKNHHLLVQGPPIDSGFRGEIAVICANIGTYPVAFDAGERIAQLVISPVVVADFTEDLGDERGDGGWGSTGR